MVPSSIAGEHTTLAMPCQRQRRMLHPKAVWSTAGNGVHDDSEDAGHPLVAVI
jgi:hypothetical protein